MPLFVLGTVVAAALAFLFEEVGKFSGFEAVTFEEGVSTLDEMFSFGKTFFGSV